MPGLAQCVKGPASPRAGVQVADEARIWRGCGCGGGWRLQLGFDPYPGNLQMPWVWPPKDQKNEILLFYFTLKSKELEYFCEGAQENKKLSKHGQVPRQRTSHRNPLPALETRFSRAPPAASLLWRRREPV